jgi:ribosomal-protein-alanine N-acetyltransferase
VERSFKKSFPIIVDSLYSGVHIKLQTPRLYLREFTLADAEMVYEMHQDPAITRYTGDPIPWDSVDLVRQILADAILPQYTNNIGRWAVHLKEDHTFIGWCGL